MLLDIVNYNTTDPSLIITLDDIAKGCRDFFRRNTENRKKDENIL